MPLASSLRSSHDFLVENARWLSAGALLTFLSCFGQTFFISIFAGEIRAEFGLSHGEWGGIYSLGTTVSAVLMVWSGALTDRFRMRALGALTLAGLALACLAMAFNPWVWALALVVLGLRFFGQGMAGHIAAVGMTRWFQATRGRALAIASLGFSVGEALFPMLFVSLLSVFDWRSLWVVCAVIALAGIPVLLNLLKSERSPLHTLQSESSTGMDGRHWTRGQALKHPLFWYIAPSVLGPSAFGTAFFFHQVHLAKIKGWSHLELVAWFPVFTGSAVIAMILSGWALDRFGTSRLMPFFQIPMVAGFLIFAVASNSFAAFFGFVCLALTTGMAATLPAAFWADSYGTAHIGAIKALATSAMVLGSAIGPGLTGVLIDFGIGLELQFVYIAGYFLATSILSWRGVQRYRTS
ncbi:MAG: MFS transporter [Rhodobacteraceae bacterium]|nr:MFS transporter [Paracoccaceae bacterium]